MALLRRDASAIPARYPQTIPQNIWIKKMAQSLQQGRWRFVKGSLSSDLWVSASRAMICRQETSWPAVHDAQ